MFQTKPNSSKALDRGEPLIDIATDFILQNQIMITYPATIQSPVGGPIRTLTRQAGYTGRLLYVEAGGNLTLRNLILDGNKANVGAAMSAIGTVSGLTMENVTVQNNVSNVEGGGVCLSVCNITMTGCAFLRNTAPAFTVGTCWGFPAQ